MGGFFRWLADWLASFWDALVCLVQSAVQSVQDALKDLFFWVFDTTLEFLAVLLAGLDTGLDAFNPATYFAALPGDVSNVLGLLGLGECIAIIVAALLIRFVLQTIPFVRWGS
jgi:hypothetical protein